MPTLTYDKKDLLNLIGKNLSDNELEDILNALKPSVERISETEITLELTPDRPDLFGIEGLARAVRKFLGIDVRLSRYKVEESKLEVTINNVAVRPFIACAVVKNVVLNDAFIKSLMNIQEVLHETIGRKRKKVAIGIHDLDKIKPPITYVGYKKTAKMIPLGTKKEMSLAGVLKNVPKGKEYKELVEHGNLWPVFVDQAGIFSFPPIINSDRTKVTQNTKNLFIELTGTDKEALLQTLNILVTNFAERNGTIEGVKILYKNQAEVTPKLVARNIKINKNLINRWVGLSIFDNELVTLLQRMGFAISHKDDEAEVTIPSYRTDILHAVDVIEDVAIAYGLNKLQPELPRIETKGDVHQIEKISENFRDFMVKMNFQEVLRPVLSNFTDQFDKMGLKRQKIIELENPVSDEYACLRISLLPSLLKVLSANKHVEYPQNIFEIGDVAIIDSNEETMSKTIRKIGAVISHSSAGFLEMKDIIERIFKSLKLKFNFRNINNPIWLKDRAAEIIVNKKPVGVVGVFHPQVLNNWQIEMPVAGFEISLEELMT